MAQGKEYIFCAWRRKRVRFTPEEYVRQTYLHHLVDSGYPAGRIGVEVALQGYRADAIIYDEHIRPLVLIECKADTVPLTQKVLDQAATYNRQLNVPYLILHNGRSSIIVKVLQEGYDFLDQLPPYEQLTIEE